MADVSTPEGRAELRREWNWPQWGRNALDALDAAQARIEELERHSGEDSEAVRDLLALCDAKDQSIAALERERDGLKHSLDRHKQITCDEARRIAALERELETRRQE